MKLFVVLCLAGGFFLGACGNHKRPADLTRQDSPLQADSNKNAFFPVAEYLESEILYVDSVPLALRKYNIGNGRTDSALIQVPEFNKLALQFLPPDLHNGNFEKSFTESSFMDKTTQSVTFSYSTALNDLALRRVDVQTSVSYGSQKVKSIYLETSRHSGDSLILQKMYWRAGRSFQVMTITSMKGKAPMEQQLKVVWGDEEDE
jgi:hypothetical protein